MTLGRVSTAGARAMTLEAHRVDNFIVSIGSLHLMGPTTLRWIRSNFQAHVLATRPQILFLNSGFQDQDKDKQGFKKYMMIMYCLTSANKGIF